MEILKKTPTNRLTLRLQNDLFETLKRSANKKDLTINSMISHILHKNFSYDEIDVLPNMIISQDLYTKMIQKIKEPDLIEIAREGPKVVKKLFDILGLQYEINFVIYNYFGILSKYCKWFEFSHKIVGDKYRLVFSTGTNPNWSIFVQNYIHAILESLKIRIMNETCNTGIIVFEFSHRDT